MQMKHEYIHPFRTVIMSIRLKEIAVSEQLRDRIKKEKRELTYDEYLSEKLFSQSVVKSGKIENNVNGVN